MKNRKSEFDGCDSLLNDNPRNQFDPTKIRWFNTFDISQYFRFIIALNWIREIFSEDTTIKRRRIGDFGCSHSQLYNYWRNNCNFFYWPRITYYGVDADEKRMTEDARRINPKRHDNIFHFVQDLTEPFKLGHLCDIIVCMEVLEHVIVKKAPALIKNILNNLLPNGYAIMSSPNPKRSEGEQFAWANESRFNHHYEWPFEEAKALVKECGFRVIKKSGVMPHRRFYSHSKHKELYRKLKEIYPPSIASNILCGVDGTGLTRDWIILLKREVK